MKKDIFANNAQPFTVPDGYFDTFQERIMNRILTEENAVKRKNVISITPLRTLVAVAACLLLIFTGAALYMANMDKQRALADLTIDEDFYRWFYVSDGATLLAESLDFITPENIMADNDTDYYEEDQAIIRFLERDNINVAAIVHSIDNEIFLSP